jgi:hypothetical protein
MVHYEPEPKLSDHSIIGRLCPVFLMVKTRWQPKFTLAWTILKNKKIIFIWLSHVYCILMSCFLTFSVLSKPVKRNLACRYLLAFVLSWFIPPWLNQRFLKPFNACLGRVHTMVFFALVTLFRVLVFQALPFNYDLVD